MITEADHANWTPSDLKIYIEKALQFFSPQRLMFGSDWPVCLLQSTYTKWIETVLSFITSLTASEQAAIMGGTAERVYLGQP